MRKQIPNAITWSRFIGFSPVALYFATHERWGWACLFLVIAGLTDIIDGWLARHLEATSAFGATLDPLADFALMLAGLSGLVITGVWPKWVGVVIMACGVTLWVIDKKAPVDSWLKKFQLAVHARLSVLILIAMLGTYLALVTNAFVAIVAGAVVLAGVGYLNRGKLPPLSSLWT